MSGTDSSADKRISGTSERREQIIQRLRQQGSVQVNDLSLLYGVSTVTIRNDLAFLDVQLSDNTAFQVLDFLQFGRRNRLAVATGHFVDLGETGPHHQEYKERDDRPDGQADHPRRIFDQRLVDLGQRLALQRIGAFEVAADRTLDGVKQH